MRLHRRQPTRLRRPWGSPGKNTGVGCHFLLQCRKVKSESEVAQSCPTLSDPRDCSLPGSSLHGIFQARVLERGATAFSEIVWVGTYSGAHRKCSLLLPLLSSFSFQVHLWWEGFSAYLIPHLLGYLLWTIIDLALYFTPIRVLKLVILLFSSFSNYKSNTHSLQKNM